MDSIASIYTPLINRNPYLLAYFLPLLLLVSVTLMNLVTAVLVEDAIASARMDSEMEKAYTRKRLKQLIPEVKQVFAQLDVSGDGFIGLGEFADHMRGLQSRKIKLPKEISKVFDPEKLADLQSFFEFLDLDGSRTISEDEFVEGVCYLSLTNVPLETTQILQMLKINRWKFDLLENQMQELLAAVSVDVQYSKVPSDSVALELVR